jgi:hypothetical protein
MSEAPWMRVFRWVREDMQAGLSELDLENEIREWSEGLLVATIDATKIRLARTLMVQLEEHYTDPAERWNRLKKLLVGEPYDEATDSDAGR